MKGELRYQEKVTSRRTSLLFAALMLFSLALFLLRVSAAGLRGWAIVFLALFVLFAFYTLNYRTLLIELTSRQLKLTFGLISWSIPLENIQECSLDEIPVLMRMGGAGIHFMFIRGRYRASFNFLEHPRLVVAFKRKAGPVRDLSFSTRKPDELLWLINEAVAKGGGA